MPQLLKSRVSNDNSVPADASTNPSRDGGSQTRLRILVDMNRHIDADLPESMLQWLHHGLDQPTSAKTEEIRRQTRHFEATIVEQLFPWQDPRTFVLRLRDHSRATALTARVVADHAAIGRKDTAFVVGWLHDMGLAVALKHLDYLTFATENAAFQKLWPELLRSAAGLAVSLASRWRLPSAIRYALREHVSFGTLHCVRATAATTFVAEHLASCMGFGFRDEQPTSGLRIALSTLRLSERELIPMGRHAEKLLGRESWDRLEPWKVYGA